LKECLEIITKQKKGIERMNTIGQLPRFKKDQVITIRLTMKDIRLLYHVSQYLEMDRSDLIRMFIRKNNNYYISLMKQGKEGNIEVNTDNYNKFGYDNQDK
jgi:hypothetical protein